MQLHGVGVELARGGGEGLRGVRQVGRREASLDGGARLEIPDAGQGGMPVADVATRLLREAQALARERHSDLEGPLPEGGASSRTAEWARTAGGTSQTVFALDGPDVCNLPGPRYGLGGLEGVRE